MSDPVQALSAGEALDRVRGGTLVLVDVRPPGERALAAVPVPYESLESGGLERLMARPRDQALAFLCHHGVRSEQAARYFLAQGFRDVHNVVGGIEAWAREVDPMIPRY